MSLPSAVSTHPQVRWAVPVVALAVIGSGVAVGSRAASADVGLAPISAQQLLVDVQQAARSGPSGLSGTVTQSLDLGLPDLSALGGGSTRGSGNGGVSAVSLLSGTHTWRVWLGGPTQQRLELLTDLGESDVYRDGSDLWLWSSADQSAVHTTLPTALPSGALGARDRAGASGLSGAATSGMPRTPAEAATMALEAMGPTTQVTTTGTDTVAGRSVYELVLTPKGTSAAGTSTTGAATRVAKVQIAVDSATKVPLRVQVYSTKLVNPAIDVGFTSVDFATPPASAFAFTPPPGAQVTQQPLPTGPTSASTPRSAQGPKAFAKGATAPKVVGTRWSSVVVASLPAGAASATSATTGAFGQAGALLGSLPKVSGTWGSGHVVDGTLFSAVLTDDGRVAVGAVAPSALYAALAAR